tara:strand:- start:26341 stop:27486 length:1146 start_codon:yes stop_codon:yes gene_type:complete
MGLFSAADNKLKNFLEEKIELYGTYRNYDYGPEEENYVSKISQFTSHRVLLEYSIIKMANQKNKSKSVNKFIEEVYWRVYWKGWLENKPKVWENFVVGNDQKYDYALYEKAINGKTNLPFFNSWVNELKDYNYLHNHSRMWFASTWIFNLGLPWELGAKFFLENLFDGDSASNTLSWRWVAGLHTKGKKYLFTPENLRKFSNNRYQIKEISNKEIDLQENFGIDFEDEIYSCSMQKKNKFLILFENDLNISTLKSLINQYQNVLLVLLSDNHRQIKISEKVFNFKDSLLTEFASNFSNIEMIQSSSLDKKLKNINQLDLLYPGVGDNLDFLKRYIYKKKLEINYLVRDEDRFSWKYAKKGFFKFKENIPKINKFIDKAVNI